MNRNEAVQAVKKQLETKRFEHTLRVAETAVTLAKRFHVSVEKAELAALLHDYAKCRPLQEMRKKIEESALPHDLLDYHSELWHAPVGALFVQEEHGVEDDVILDAIRYHTTGRAHMNKLEMVVLLADYIEPGRSFPGLDDVRKVAEDDLFYGCWLATRNTIQFLMGKQSMIYPDTIHAYNDLTTQINGGHSFG